MPVYQVRLERRMIVTYNEYESTYVFVDAPTEDLARELIEFVQEDEDFYSQIEDWDTGDTDCIESETSDDGVEIAAISVATNPPDTDLAIADYPDFLNSHNGIDTSDFYDNTNI